MMDRGKKVSKLVAIIALMLIALQCSTVFALINAPKLSGRMTDIKKISFTWNKVAGAHHYVLQVKLPNCPYVTAYSGPNGYYNFSFRVKGTYYARVYCADRNGNLISSASNTISWKN